MRKVLVGLIVVVLLVVGAYHLSRARSVQLFGEAVTSVPTDQMVVALTFDDGPTARFTQELLTALGDTPATFFLVGSDIVANPDAAAAIVEAGHEIGNHSYTHPRMVLMSPARVRAEIEDTDAAIRGLGYDGPIHFRPPFGKKLVVLPWVLSQMDRPSLMWSLEPDTALGGDATAEALADYVIAQAAPGDIILLHGMFSTNAATRAALPAMIEGLSDRGFTFVTVSELLALDG
ncbi:polysaccharide deacetylase family protein [Rhodobacteraceae bacterium M385]|nr:polysaccharide deacetylase family protein [Rhodobacteraceae bacterium M385]